MAKKSKKSQSTAKKAVYKQAQRALAVLGNYTPSSDQMELAVAATIRGLMAESEHSFIKLALDIMSDTGACHQDATSAALCIGGLITSEPNGEELAIWLKEGGKRPKVSRSLLQCVGRIDEVSGTAVVVSVLGVLS